MGLCSLTKVSRVICILCCSVIEDSTLQGCNAMLNSYSVVVVRFKWSEKKAVSSFKTWETTFPTTNFLIFSRASNCTLFSSNFTSDLGPWVFFSFLEVFLQIVGILLFAVLWKVHPHALNIGINLKYTCRLLCWGGNLAVHILCECEALVSLRHTHLGSFILDPEDIRKLSIGAIWNFTKGTGKVK